MKLKNILGKNKIIIVLFNFIFKYLYKCFPSEILYYQINPKKSRSKVRNHFMKYLKFFNEIKLKLFGRYK